MSKHKLKLHSTCENIFDKQEQVKKPSRIRNLKSNILRRLEHLSQKTTKNREKGQTRGER